MVQDLSHEVETIVNALLQVSDRVLEISRDHVITRIWDSDTSVLGDGSRFIGKRITEIRNEQMFLQVDDMVTRSFSLKENNYFQYHKTSENHEPATYGIRILAIHPDKDFLFIVVRDLSAIEGIEVVEDKWRLALDAAGDGMWDLNMQTGKIFFSPKWHDIFGYNPTDVTTWDEWSAKIHPRDQQRYRQTIDDYLAGQTPSYSVELRYLCKDGNYKWILSRGVVISRTGDGKPLRAIGTHHDINLRKLAEEELKTSREIFASAFDHSGIGIALIGPDGNWVDVNTEICRMTGYPKEELMKLTHVDVTHPDDRDIDRGLIDQMLDKDIFTYTIEKRYLSREQKIVVGLLNVSLVWNSDNTPKFFICQVIDITRKKELENELKRKNAELEMTRIKMENKVNRLEELNHIIANNLRTPAAHIRDIAGALAGGDGQSEVYVKGMQQAMRKSQALEMIRESSNSLMTTLDTLAGEAERK